MDFIQEPLNKFLNYLKVKIKSLEAKFYLFGISVIAFSTILILNRQNNIITLVILSAGIILFCLGFMFWCYSLLKMRWIINTAKIFLILLNIPTYFNIRIFVQIYNCPNYKFARKRLWVNIKSININFLYTSRSFSFLFYFNDVCLSSNGFRNVGGDDN